MNILRKIDRFLDGITMYRLVLYGLFVIAAAGLVSSLVGTLSLPFGAMLLSLGLITATCFVTNRGLSSLQKITPNAESWLITAMILFCILPPATTLARALAIVLASIVAIAPRYLVAIHGKHAFNPAAAGAFTIAVLGLAHAAWWVGTPALLPFTLLVGLLVVRKMRRFAMVGVFALAALGGLAVYALLYDRSAATLVSQAVLSGPFIFLATIMLTEPSTMPPRFRSQLLYGGIVGVLYASHLHWWVLSSSPETALLAGNVFAYLVSQRYRLRLTLVKKVKLSERVYDFVFKSNRKPLFIPGQYMEWTARVPDADVRGNRRTFTIASSPNEDEIHLGVKFYEPSSAFKRTLKAMEPGDTLFAGQIAGDFVLPKAYDTKLLWIAGGIGITPFRSMAKQLIDTQQHRDIVLFYVVSDPAELSYLDIFKHAAAYGLQVVPVVSAAPGSAPPASWQGKTGFLTEAMVREAASDYSERMVYVSGPHAMVEQYGTLLKHMGIARQWIRTDHFSGY